MNRVPLIYAFSDGPRKSDKDSAVAEVRRILHSIDWCEVVLCERNTNLGLGRSILTGVTKVLEKHEAAIIFEDDLICVQGIYDYLCSALEHYRDDQRVMSVTGWTHPLITPGNITNQPYFDGRAECWVWGIWARAWKGMETDAKTLMEKCKAQGIDVYGYGADLVEMAKGERWWNIWAVRLLYWHIINRGLCLRPPWSMVEHIGFDKQGANAVSAGKWAALPLKPCPPIPKQWPEPIEHVECALLHQSACGTRPSIFKLPYLFLRRIAPRSVRHVLPKLKASILEKGFRPGFLGLFVNPFYFARKGLYQNIIALSSLVRGRILDVGCGSKPYRKHFDASEYIGLEIEGRNKHADLHYGGNEFPFKDGEFDSVLTSQVLEHVFNPEEFLIEINRVLKEDGVLLLTVPFVWDEHEQPFDYARYSSFGLRHLLEGHGFEIVHHRKSMNDIRVIFQMINAYIYKKTHTNSATLNLLFTLMLMAPFNLAGELIALILPRNNDLYLDNVVLARKKRHSKQIQFKEEQ